MLAHKSGKNETTEYEGQQLSSIDAENHLMYLIAYDVNTKVHKTSQQTLIQLQLQTLNTNHLKIVGSETNSKVASLLGLDLATGNQVYNVPLPFEEPGFIGVGQIVEVNTNTGDVFVCGRDPSKGGQHHIMR